MPEPDPGGVGGGLIGGQSGGTASNVFRGKGKVSLEYKDIDGLKKSVDALSTAFQSLRSAVESLDSDKARRALGRLQKLGGGSGMGTGERQTSLDNGGEAKISATSYRGTHEGVDKASGVVTGPAAMSVAAGAGGATAGTMTTAANGGSVKFDGMDAATGAMVGAAAARGAGGGGEQGRFMGFATNPRNLAMIGVGMAGINRLVSQRQGPDLASDVLSMRTTMMMPQSSFGLRDTNRLWTEGLGGYWGGREEGLSATASLLGLYGSPTGSGMQSAFAGTRAIAGAVPGMPIDQAADVYNRMQSGTMLNRMRSYTGTSGWQEDPLKMSQSAMQFLFRGRDPNAEELSYGLRQGTNLNRSLNYMTGGDTEVAEAMIAMEMARARHRELNIDRPFNQQFLDDLVDDRGLQRQMFGEESLALTKLRSESNKAKHEEEMLSLQRQQKVEAENTVDWLKALGRQLEDLVSKHLPGFTTAINTIAGLSGSLGGIVPILGALGVAGLGKKAIGALGGRGAASAAQHMAPAAGRGLLGAGLGAAAKAALPITAGWVASDKLTDLVRGRVAPDNLPSTWEFLNPLSDHPTSAKAYLGGAVDSVSKVTSGRWIPGVGDPIDDTRPPMGDPVAGGVRMPSVSEATEILASRSTGGRETAANLQPDFKQKLAAMFLANPKLTLTSGWRSSAAQARLYDRWKRRVPGQAPAAPPGRSNHEFGLAADVAPRSEYNWLYSNRNRFGLVRPMDYEPWHYEPPNARARRNAAGSALPSSAGVEVSGMGAPEGPRGVSASAVIPQGTPDQIFGSGSRPALSGVAIGASAGTGTDPGATGPGGATVEPWAGGSGAITINQAARYARAAGLPESQVALAVAIAMGESGLRPGAQGDQHLAGGKWGNSIGLWQIRSLNAQRGTGQSRDADALGSPSFNAKSMMEISSGGTNWRPWTVYTKGLYQKHMGQVQQALSTGIGDPVGDPVSPEMSSGSGSIAIHGGGIRVNADLKVYVQQASEEEASRFAKMVIEKINAGVADADARGGH